MTKTARPGRRPRSFPATSSSARSSSWTTRPPPTGGTSPSATGWPPSRSCRAGRCRYCNRGKYWMCGPHDMYGFKRRTPGGMAEYMVFPADALVHKLDPGPPCGARRFRRAAVVRPARGRAGRHRFRRRRRRRRLRPDRARHDRGCGREVAGAGRSPSTWPTAKLALAGRCGATTTLNIAERRRAESGRGLTEGYGADVYLEGTRSSLRRGSGPEPAAKAGHLRRVQRLRQRRQRGLDHHQRRQGTRRPGCAPRTALLAGRRPHARPRAHCRWATSSPTSCRWRSSRTASVSSQTARRRSRSR